MSEVTSLESRQSSEHPPGTIEVTVKHQGSETKVIGTPDRVIRELITYFSKLYPSLELTQKLLLSVDQAEFLQSCTGILAVSQEGLAILKDPSGLRDRELVMLHLAGSRLSHILGKKDTDNTTLEALTRATRRSTGTTAGRLSELGDDQLVERTGKGSYRLTTIGARTVMKTLMPKLASFPDR